LNKQEERLDYHLPPPSPSDQQAYTCEFPDQNKPCNWFSLWGRCNNGPNCSYVHVEVSPEVQAVIRYMTKNTACRKGSLCRRLSCIYGHVCQDPSCIDEDRGSCPMRAFHQVDPVLHSWVREGSVTDLAEDPADGSAGLQADTAEDTAVQSFWF
jgi:hypothetical protein